MTVVIWLLKPFSSDLRVSFWTRTMIKPVICRKACSDRKPRNTCRIRHFLYLRCHSRTSRIDHGVLMKYASGVSGEDPAQSIQSVFLRLLPARCQWTSAVLSSFTCFHRSASFSPSLSLCHSRTLIASIFVHLRNHQELPTWRKASIPEWQRTTNGNRTGTDRGTCLGFFPFLFFLFKI